LPTLDGKKETTGKATGNTMHPFYPKQPILLQKASELNMKKIVFWKDKVDLFTQFLSSIWSFEANVFLLNHLLSTGLFALIVKKLQLRIYM